MAKTASKNSPSQRQKAKVFKYHGKEIKPTLFIGEVGQKRVRMMVGQDKASGDLVLDNTKSPIAWSEIVKDCVVE